jgi:hypothetical protein
MYPEGFNEKYFIYKILHYRNDYFKRLLFLWSTKLQNKTAFCEENQKHFKQRITQRKQGMRK